MMKGPAQEMEGGRIIRSIGRKDRHSKVYTAKGPRDRRVRLSAHTAIQFYDVQDRLGYDRPSKAVDWLITKAQAAIHSLNHDPPPPPPDSNPSSTDLPCEYTPQNNNHDASFLGEPDLMKSFFPPPGFGSFQNVPCQNAPFPAAADLGLSLQTTFQGGGQSNSNGWNGAGGIFTTFAQSQRELLQSNAAENPWNQTPFISPNHRNDFGLGFRVPARIYGEEEDAAENDH